MSVLQVTSRPLYLSSSTVKLILFNYHLEEQCLFIDRRQDECHLQISGKDHDFQDCEHCTKKIYTLTSRAENYKVSRIYLRGTALFITIPGVPKTDSEEDVWEFLKNSALKMNRPKCKKAP